MSLTEIYGILVVGSGYTGRRVAILANNASHCVVLVSGRQTTASDTQLGGRSGLHRALGDRVIFGSIEFVSPRTLRVASWHGGPERVLTGDRVFIDLENDGLHSSPHQSNLINTNMFELLGPYRLAMAGIDVDFNGSIIVNERLETTSAKTWAMGNSAGGPGRPRTPRSDFAILKATALKLPEDGG